MAQPGGPTPPRLIRYDVDLVDTGVGYQIPGVSNKRTDEREPKRDRGPPTRVHIGREMFTVGPPVSLRTLDWLPAKRARPTGRPNEQAPTDEN